MHIPDKDNSELRFEPLVLRLARIFHRWANASPPFFSFRICCQLNVSFLFLRCHQPSILCDDLCSCRISSPHNDNCTNMCVCVAFFVALLCVAPFMSSGVVPLSLIASCCIVRITYCCCRAMKVVCYAYTFDLLRTNYLSARYFTAWMQLK